MSEGLSRALEDQKHNSFQVGQLSRYICFGLIAITYFMVSSDSQFAMSVMEERASLVLGIGLLGCIGILLDYLQYASGYLSANKAVNNKANEYKYSPNWASYKLRHVFFLLKQAATLMGSAMLIALIVSDL